MHSEHRKLLRELRSIGDPPAIQLGGENDSYGGSGHIFYRVSVPARRRIAKNWIGQHRAWTAEQVLAVVESLFCGKSHEEKTLAALILGYCPLARGQARPVDLERWLGQLNGWAEVDSLCQNVFTAEELLGTWRAWRGSIRGLSKHSSANHRRASLVLLTGPVHYSKDERLGELAFETIERLKHERIILITKAISWLLRSMVGHHREAVLRYLDENSSTLPKIAIRETRTKLHTGRKTRRRST
jgi:3-methyladenine DNA glycosylase AlkD